MWWIGCVHGEKSRRDFVARTYTLIAPVDPILQRVSCSYETIPNTTKHYETHQNMSLGSNGVDWVHLLQKIPMGLRGTIFCINCTSSPCFGSSFMSYEMIPNASQNYATHQNMSLGSNGADWVRSLRKIQMWLCNTNFCINCTSSPCFCVEFHAVSKRSQMHSNTMERTKTWV